MRRLVLPIVCLTTTAAAQTAHLIRRIDKGKLIAAAAPAAHERTNGSPEARA